MSLMLLGWLGSFAALTWLTLRRPAYGVSLYLFTFFVNPIGWWWGDSIEGFRWNLYAALILAVGVFLNRQQGHNQPAMGATNDPIATKDSQTVGLILKAMLANAVLVHLVLAAPGTALTLLILLLKFVPFYFLMVAAIRSRADLRLVIWSLVVCAAYIGYEVTVNDRGMFVSGRLEGITASSVAGSNELASLMLTAIPFGGYLFLTGTRFEKILAAVTTALNLNVFLLCNSRGGFLGLIAAGLAVLAMAPKGARGKIVKGLMLGGLALVLLLRDPEIVQRFMTIFVSSEERDGSSQVRMLIWRAAVRQIIDHPLGAGGESFSHIYGQRYLPTVGYSDHGRSVHNGFLNEVTNWGFQGLFLRMTFFYLAFRISRRVGRQCALSGNSDGALLGACLMSAGAGILTTAMFGDFLDDDWGIWCVALAAAYGRIYTEQPRAAVVSVPPANAEVRVRSLYPKAEPSTQG